MKEKLKIGLMLDSNVLTAWKYSIIETISKSDFAAISVVIKNIQVQLYGISNDHSLSLVYRFHKKLDRLIFAAGNNYSKKKDIQPLIKDVPEVKIKAIENNNCEELLSGDIDIIRKYNLDIILKFGFRILTGQILKVPEYGIWSYSMDNYDTIDTTGYYEVVKKIPVTGSELVILRDNGNENLLISNAWESTCSYSIHLNRDKLFQRASLFTIRLIQGINKYGKNYLTFLEKKYEKNILNECTGLPVPSFIPSVTNFAGAIVILIRKIYKKVFYSDPFSWILLYKKNDANDFLDYSYSSYNKLSPSKDKFWADPFVISKDDKYYIFVEEFIYKKTKGHISLLELDNNGELLNVRKLIEKPYHISYPFILELGGELYMIPETAGNRTIELYKCVDFPGNWVFVKNIMDNINAVDTTVFNYNNRWWLFTVIDEIDSSLDDSPELFLFFTDNILTDNWISHPLNPIVSDIRTARPAGKVFIHEKKIYRPSQDCAGRYGKAFNINQILKLTDTDYEEVLVKKVEPDWDNKLKGTHTFNFDNGFNVIDAYSLRRRQFLLS
jgi:hypothetical protein